MEGLSYIDTLFPLTKQTLMTCARAERPSLKIIYIHVSELLMFHILPFKTCILLQLQAIIHHEGGIS